MRTNDDEKNMGSVRRVRDAVIVTPPGVIACLGGFLVSEDTMSELTRFQGNTFFFSHPRTEGERVDVLL